MRAAWLAALVAASGAATGCTQRDPNALDAAGKQRLAALVAEVEGRVKSCEAAFRAATAPEALAKLAVAEERCPAPLDAPARGGSSTKTLDAKYFQVWTVRRVRAGAPVGDATGCDPWRFALDQARGEQADRSALVTLERSAKENRIGSFEAIVLVSDEKAPVSQGGGAFEAGSLRGRAYLYDYGAGSVVCAGDVDTASSAKVPVRFKYHEMNVLDADWKRDLAAPKALERDLEAQLRRAVTQLKRLR